MKKIIIITGANRGLGKALVDIALKDEDAIIVSFSRSLHNEHNHISKTKLIFIKTDLSESFSASIFEIIDKKLASNATLYFFNNASIILPIDKIGRFKEMDIEMSIKVNVQYPVNLINSLLNKFPNNKIILVNISSGAGNNPIPFWSLYGAAKAYMKLFFRTLEEENKDNNKIKLYSIDPGVLDTGMQENIRDNAFPNQDYFRSLKEDNKLIKPEDAALKIFLEINYYI
ncbi:benzil reductase ((S)-benzoin forming) [Flavobacterium fluvii]|uniref:Benzil reductase ((S)-benzoin forming) n=1 Tax=Flavobacterium fluvii TaxID=468056 RepID=A0A1M5IMV4_9FLAO|nr:SDR family NAD(P)-dependent oxidoreductase [Flavobacterium fluvii]SHG29571.1 benzil reductase ((S)-benzoin forming) [Flavobacterium fluvii]